MTRVTRRNNVFGTPDEVVNLVADGGTDMPGALSCDRLMLVTLFW